MIPELHPRRQPEGGCNTNIRHSEAISCPPYFSLMLATLAAGALLAAPAARAAFLPLPATGAQHRWTSAGAAG